MLHKVVKSIPFALLLAAAPAGAKDTALQMVSIDVEGGGGTLFVTPDGKSYVYSDYRILSDLYLATGLR